ncbi:MAG: hypothetical protein AAF823_09050 [Planctomycetota bacterium]
MKQTTATTCMLDELDRLEAIRNPEHDAREKRAFERFVIRRDAELHPMNRSMLDPVPVEIKLRDLSHSGFGFIADQPLVTGSLWRCCFLDSGYVIGELACQIRHGSQVGSSLYLYGAQVVIPTGLMLQLGVDARHLHRSTTMTPSQPTANPEANEAFLQPHEVEVDD